MWPRLTNPNRKIIGIWKDLGMGCLPSHQNAALHIHAGLRLFDADKTEVIPANIGIVQGCMAEVHTHESDGVIHIESVKAGETFTLGQFFSVWGKTIAREGFGIEVTLNGENVENPEAIILNNEDAIEITYARI